MAFIVLEDNNCMLNTDNISLITDENGYRNIIYDIGHQALKSFQTDLSMEELADKINEANREFSGVSAPLPESEAYYAHMNEMTAFQKQTQKRLNQLELAFAKDEHVHVLDTVKQKQRQDEYM